MKLLPDVTAWLDAQPQWVSISTYAKTYNVTRQTVYKWIAADLLATYRVGHIIRVGNQPPMTTAEREAIEAPQAPMPAVSAGVMAKRLKEAKKSRTQVRCGREPVPALPGVYVIRHGALVKIGCSSNLRYRLSTLQTAFPLKLTVVGYAQGSSTAAAFVLEAELHRLCRADRLRGEWFHLSADVVSAIRPRMTTWDAESLVDRAHQQNV